MIKIEKFLSDQYTFFIGALAWGIHVASVGGIDNNPVDIPYINIIRISIVIFLAFAVFHYVKFLNRQDELMQRYHDFVFSWGAIGFLVLGKASLISIFAFFPSFYDNFVGSVFELID